MKSKVAAVLQVTGAVSLSAAGFLFAVVAGFVVLGVLALAFGVALEREAAVVAPPAVDVDAELGAEDGD